MPAALEALLQGHVDRGAVPGAVALVARGDDVEVAAVGGLDVGATAPMQRDSIFRIASITKPITAAATMLLAEDGTLALDDPISNWIPQLASPSVLRTPGAAVDDVVALQRPITVEDLLTFRAGWGFPSDFSLPVVAMLMSTVQSDSRNPRAYAAANQWLAALARIPLLAQPGDVWLYNTCSDILGILIERASGQPFAEFLAERIFVPVGMPDTGFVVPAAERHRMTSYYVTGEDGRFELADPPDGQWTTPAPFPSGAGGLLSTVDDWSAFGRMLLNDGAPILSSESVRLMMSDHLAPAQREAGALFLAGQGWGFGGSVDLDTRDPWNVPGRYGWVGGTGTSAHVTPSTGTISLLFTQVALDGPTSPDLMHDFWTYAGV